MKLEAFQQLIDGTTPGPWKRRDAGGRPGVWAHQSKVASVDAPHVPGALIDQGRGANADFIASARNIAPALARLWAAAQKAVAESDERHAAVMRDGETDAYCSMLTSLREALAVLESEAQP